MDYRSIREDIVRYSRLMYNEHLVSATSGNISIRLPDRSDAFAITPSSESYLSMEADRIVIMTVDGTVLQCPEDGKPSSEWRLHAELYKAKPAVNAIVHTHSPYATSFSVLRETIPLILIEMEPWLGGPIPLAEYAPTGSLQLGLNVARDIGDAGGCLMANHGAVAVGDSLNLAYVRASYVEDAAKIYHMARCVGKPVVIEKNN
jgi:L-ribulose-5-phosphate 4-epimerase